MRRSLPSTVGSFISDTYAVLLPGLPGGNLAGQTVNNLIHLALRRRTEAAFEILLEQVRKSRSSGALVEDVEPLVAMMMRYQRAAVEGSAVRNLRLLARVFSGVAQMQPIVADEFQSWADTLQSLRHLEIVALAEVHTYAIKCKNSKSGMTVEYPGDAFAESLTPQPFRTTEEFYAYCHAASRTGLIAPQGDQMLFDYASTSLMDRLVKFVDFEEILQDDCTKTRRED